MSKKIKILLSIFTLLIILSITNVVFGTTSDVSGVFNEITTFRPTSLYPYTSKLTTGEMQAVTYGSGYYTFYCAEKGGALRLFYLKSAFKDGGESDATEDSPAEKNELEYYKIYENTEDVDYGSSTNSSDSCTISEAKTKVFQEGQAFDIISSEINKIVNIASSTKNQAYSTNDEYASWSGNGNNKFATNVFSKFYNEDGEAFEENPDEDKYQWSQRYVGYTIAEAPTYTVKAQKEFKYNRLAYILSSGFRKPKDNSTIYPGSTSDEVGVAGEKDKQVALWLDTQAQHTNDNDGDTYYHNQGRELRDSEKTENGQKLYEEAKSYEEFYNNHITKVDNGDYSEEHFDKYEGNKQITIVNRNEGTYTVGPFTITYPENANNNNRKFLYIQSMTIKDQNGNNAKTVNNEQNQFKIIKEGNETLFPGDGEKFFIEFKASDLGNPSSIQIEATFNYLKLTEAKYAILEGKGTIYQYEATISIELEESEHSDTVVVDRVYRNFRWEDVTENVSWKTVSGEVKGIVTLRKADSVTTSSRVSYNGQTTVVTEEEHEDDNWEEAYKTIKRQWNTFTISSKDVIKIDLTTKVEGRVWVDNAATKESKVNGLYGGEDTPMPNVEVVLYRYGDNAIMGTTYTDANGHYEFNNLSALSQYYVRFKYNAQYYEPTYYTSPTDYSNGWENTSNGTDYQNGVDGRLTFNAKFATINSSTANYYGAAGYNETFTKKELLGYTLNNNGEYVKTRQAVIDDFGRLILESSSDATTQKMIQYVKDSTMYSWTKSPSDNIDPYPYSNIIVINYGYDRYNNLANITVQRSSGDAYSWSGVNSIINIAQNDKSQHINQGYKVRQESDIALKNDVDHVTLEINGKTQEYRYDTRENASNADGTWEIGVRLSDAYYSTNYSREVYPSDYQYRITSYGSQPELYGKTKDDELKIYVTYKLTVRNQSMSIRTRIDEIVDYFDSDYEYVADRSYIQITRGANNGRYDVKASTTSRYDSLPETKTTINEYQNLYIRGLDGIYLDAGQTAYVYLTFVVEKDSNDYIKLDEVARTGQAIGVGKENIAEINGYSTLYKEGTEIPNVGLAGANKQAGIIDVDSNPGNLKASYVPKDGTIQYNKFEDDTDKAPNIRIILDRDEGSNARITSGYVWEDNRNQIIDTQATATGNGIREDGETLINGVTVQLVELMDNGTEFVWRTYENGTGTANRTSPIINIENIIKDYEITGDTKGTYAFKSFVPGNYVVRFIYGDTVKTVLPNSSEVTNLLGQNGLNAKSYNGQDYKSTIYQLGLDTYKNGENTYKSYTYDIAKGDTTKVVSDAKDIWSDGNSNIENGRQNATLNSRADVIAYSNKEIRNSFAEELVSYMSIPEYNGTKYDKAKMQSMLDNFINGSKMTAETGVIDIEIEYNRKATENQTVNNVNPYHIVNLDLGLEERPKAQIEINKDVKNLKITLANGNILFDASQGTDNLAWINNPTYYSYNKNNMMDSENYGSIDNIRNSRSFGLVQPTIDKELMHGATVRITYEITAINVGETDYKEEQFYYTDIVGNTNNIVTTTANQLVDYVPNNLQYYERDNSEYWQVVKTDNLIAGTNNLVNSSLKDNLNKFNTIITTTKTNTALVPAIYTQKVNTTKTDRVSVPLVLTQLITSENKDDDLDYINKVEMVAESNIVGRKMAYSVVGNQDPTGSIAELDADMAEVRVLPPFGVNLRYIMIALITIAGASIIIAGIIFIKKKVLVK